MKFKFYVSLFNQLVFFSTGFKAKTCCASSHNDGTYVPPPPERNQTPVTHPCVLMSCIVGKDVLLCVTCIIWSRKARWYHWYFLISSDNSGTQTKSDLELYPTTSVQLLWLWARDCGRISIVTSCLNNNHSSSAPVCQLSTDHPYY